MFVDVPLFESELPNRYSSRGLSGGGGGELEVFREVHGGLKTSLNFQFAQVSRSQYKHWRGIGKVQGMMPKDDFSWTFHKHYYWALN